MRNNNLVDDVKRTGVAFRDWLTPYYTLGGAVAFCIAMFTLLDPSGQLVRFVSAGLFLLTVTVWVFHLWRRSAKPSQPSDASSLPAVKPHAILLAVTAFFLVGMLVSESLMRSRNGGGTVTATRVTPSPHTDASALPTFLAPNPVPGVAPLGMQDKVEVTTFPHSAPALAEPTAVGTSAVALSAAPANSAASPKGSQVQAIAQSGGAIPTGPAPGLASPRAGAQKSPTKAQHPDSKPKANPAQNPPQTKVATASQNPRSTEIATGAAEHTANAADRQRCSSLLSKFSLGEELRPQDTQMLETSCR